MLYTATAYVVEKNGSYLHTSATEQNPRFTTSPLEEQTSHYQNKAEAKRDADKYGGKPVLVVTAYAA